MGQTKTWKEKWCNDECREGKEQCTAWVNYVKSNDVNKKIICEIEKKIQESYKKRKQKLPKRKKLFN